MNVSVLGGNTANTEFEFLTGSTIGFLPQGSVAYQQYVQEDPFLISYYLYFIMRILLCINLY